MAREFGPPGRSAGAEKPAASALASQTLGGGIGTKLHAAVNPLGHPVALELTGAKAADGPRLPGLIAGVKADAVLADKGYDSDANRAAVQRRGADRRIPGRKNRRVPVVYDRHLYHEWNVVGRFFARIKQCRQVATRFD